MITYYFQLLTAGIWPLIWHWGIGYGIAILCLVGAFGTQFIAMIPAVGPSLASALGPFRRDLIIAAALVSAAIAYATILVQDEASRCVAKTQVITRTVTKTVDLTEQEKQDAIKAYLEEQKRPLKKGQKHKQFHPGDRYDSPNN